MQRRKILQSIGTGFATAAYPSTVAASSGKQAASDEVISKDTVKSDLNLRTEDLTSEEFRRNLNQARSKEPVQSILQTLRSNRINPDLKEGSGKELRGDIVRPQVLLELPLKSRQRGRRGHSGRNAQHLTIRIFEDQSVRAEAYMGGAVYISSPMTIEESDTDVVSGEEWHSLKQDSEVSLQSDHYTCNTTSVTYGHQDICPYLKWLAGTAGGIAIVIPEPGTTAGGLATIAVTAAQCDLMDGLKRHFGDCAVGDVTVCLGEQWAAYQVWPADPECRHG